MSHRHSSRHRYNAQTSSDGDGLPYAHAYGKSSSDSLPEAPSHAYYELVPGSMIDGRRAYPGPNDYAGAYEHAGPHPEPRIHYDDHRWSKDAARGPRAGDAKQGALVMMAASLFGLSVVAGTVLFAYYILSCYGIY